MSDKVIYVLADGSAWGLHGGELEFVRMEEVDDKVHLIFTDHDVQVCKDAPEGRHYRMICSKSDWEPTGEVTVSNEDH